MSIFNRKLKETIESQEKQINTLQKEFARLERIMVWAKEDRPTFRFVEEYVPIVRCTYREGFKYPYSEMTRKYCLYLYIHKWEYMIPIEESDWKWLSLDMVERREDGESELEVCGNGTALLTICSAWNKALRYRFTIDYSSCKYVITKVDEEASEIKESTEDTEVSVERKETD